MPPLRIGPRAYEDALTELAEAVAQAQALAGVLDYFASQLRGMRPEPEGPPMEHYPTQGQVRRALERLDRARAAAREQWEWLPSDQQQACEYPDDLLNL